MTNLISKTIAGFLFLMFMLALALFIPAGTLNFWQAWLYLAVWAICVSLITVYLIKNDQELLAGRVQAGPVAETQKSQKIIQSLASVCFIGLFIVPGLDVRSHASDIPLLVSVIADGFVAFGFFIVFLTFRENSYTRATIEVSDTQTVITSGPYRLVRHPMYAGALLLLFFTPLALGSWLALLFVVFLMGVIIVRLTDEEKFLKQNLAGYVAYCQKVPYHLIPYVW